MSSSPYFEFGSLLHLSGSQFPVRVGDKIILPSVSHPLSMGPGMLSGNNITSKVEAHLYEIVFYNIDQNKSNA